MRWRRLLAGSLLLATAGRAGAFDLGENQVLIETTLVSIAAHDDLQLGLALFAPGERIDAPTEAQIETSLGLAAAQTQSVISGIEADDSLATSPIGRSALDHFALARMEQIHLQSILSLDGQPKAKELLTPLIAGQSFQVAALNALQGRPDRFPDARLVSREAAEFWSAYTGVLPFLAAHGLPSDRSALFEPFSAGKGKSLAERIGLEPGLDTRTRFRNGQLEISALTNEPFTAGSDFGFRLPDDFTLLMTFSLPDKGDGKPRLELENFSAGIKLTSDTSSDPAEAFFIEHQTTPAGWAQSFVSTKTAIAQVFPHATASHARQITSFFVKADDTLVVGALLRDGTSETLIQRSVPVLGDLPVLGLYFRNGTKKTVLEADNLIIFVTPHLVVEP